MLAMMDNLRNKQNFHQLHLKYSSINMNYSPIIDRNNRSSQPQKIQQVSICFPGKNAKFPHFKILTKMMSWVLKCILIMHSVIYHIT
jgi:hypothetical protein